MQGLFSGLFMALATASDCCRYKRSNSDFNGITDFMASFPFVWLIFFLFVLFWCCRSRCRCCFADAHVVHKAATPWLRVFFLFRIFIVYFFLCIFPICNVKCVCGGREWVKVLLPLSRHCKVHVVRFKSDVFVGVLCQSIENHDHKLFRVLEKVNWN